MKIACFITFSVALAVTPAAPALAQLHATRDRTIQQPAPNHPKTEAPSKMGAVGTAAPIINGTTMRQRSK